MTPSVLGGKKHCFKKLLRNKVSLSFHNFLTTHESFRSHPKAIMAALAFLGYVAKWTAYNKTRETTAHSVLIQDLFYAYCPEVKYTVFIRALETLGLLSVDRGGRKGTPGHSCYGYLCTPKAIELLQDSSQTYFYKLHEEKKTIRKTQQNISKSKILKDTYNDWFLDHMHAVRCNVTYDFEEVKTFAKGLTNAQQVQLLDGLSTLKDKRFADLYYAPDTGRVWDTLLNLPKESRALLKVHGKAYAGEIDQRACHFSFLGELLFTLNTLHYITPLGDISTERNRFREFANDPVRDPRETLSKELKIPLGTIKDRINRWLNTRKDRKLNAWFAREFPGLNAVWSTIDPKTTGVRIMHDFESRIWSDPKLYQWLKKHGLEGVYGYDGISIYGDATDALMKEFQCFISGIALERVGHGIVTKFKTGLSKADITELRNAIVEFQRECAKAVSVPPRINATKREMHRIRTRYWACKKKGSFEDKRITRKEWDRYRYLERELKEWEAGQQTVSM